MGRHRLPEGEKKVPASFNIKEKYITELRKIPKYNLIVEQLIEKYLRGEIEIDLRA